MLVQGPVDRCRKLAVLMLMLLVAGCASRPGPEVLSPVGPAPGIAQVTVYTATTRAPSGDEALHFTSERAHAMRFARYTVAIPPVHQPSQIEWPTGTPDPSRSFAVVDRTVLAQQAFLDEVQAASRSTANVGAGIFVHGFNYNFPETVFRLAQLSADATLEGPQIAFSWPSQANLRGYLDDLNSATYSRDYLAELIIDVAARTRGDIAIVGHSMGAWLVMETVRQLRLEGYDQVIGRLRVILAAPDIDVDVFRQQLQVIGPLDRPMMVLVSPDDRALLFSELLSASRPRIGTSDVRDPEVQAAARANNVQIVDISALADTSGAGHDRYIALATTIPDDQGPAGPAPLRDIRRAGVFILDALGATLATPFDLAGQALGGE
ncbi:MAG TPA: alpha/beta fold hydrolase [Aestuariivirgaceae bacterium]|nr:alpha/beta fold hydrolase [Aestuariivirgaceae bacterium]